MNGVSETFIWGGYDAVAITIDVIFRNNNKDFINQIWNNLSMQCTGTRGA